MIMEENTMKMIHECYEKKFANLPEKVLQFGEGNFLRAFADWMIELSNRKGDFNGSVVLCQPIARGMGEVLNAQNCQYSVVMRGIEDGESVERIEQISSISRCINPYEDYQALMDIAHSETLRCIISNTTEAGIAYHAGDKRDDRPPVSYPAKVCAFLHERFTAFNGDPDKGLLLLPVELIDNNGHELKRIVLQYAEEWNLGEAFITWLKESCCFASTLVDRIVTGYPRDEINELQEKIGYEDKSLVTCEVFNLWVIEADEKWADVFPVAKTDAHVIWTPDVTPYKKRKVRILNGAHTGTVLAAYLAGHDIVLDFMKDEAFNKYMNDMLMEEIVPTLDLPRDELISFAAAVNDRFSNPFIRHRLLDISLNSCSKFCARNLPSLLGYYEQYGKLPAHLTFALAAFISFYRGEWEDGRYYGTRKEGTKYEIRDDQAVLEFISKAWEGGCAEKVAKAVLSNKEFWGGRDLTEIPGMEAAVAAYIASISEKGVHATIAEL